MVATARSAQTRILFVMPVRNQRSEPMLSLHRHGFTRGAEFKALLESAALHAKAGNVSAAMSDFDRAIEMSPEYALTWYMRGIIKLGAGLSEQALDDLQVACDADAQTHRMTTPLQEALVRVARELGAPLVDPRPAFRATLTHQAPGLFVDHCHPTPEGHALIADLLLPAVLSAIGEQ
jgi:tetratricopeptide (TPR) repeat protein